MSNQSQRVNSTSIQAAVERAQLVCKPSIPNTELKSIKMVSYYCVHIISQCTCANDSIGWWSKNPVSSSSTSRSKPILLFLSNPKTWLIDASYRYPKHVWSPAGGWYTQPANWKANVLVFGAAVFGIAALTWNTSANEEYRDYMPRPDRFYPSR